MSSENMKVFSERLRDLRKSAGLTQQQISERLHIRQQSYARYESGAGEPNLETLAKIAAILDVTSDYLLGLSEF